VARIWYLVGGSSLDRFHSLVTLMENDLLRSMEGWLNTVDAAKLKLWPSTDKLCDARMLTTPPSTKDERFRMIEKIHDLVSEGQ
jgi:hypothetical protein